MAATASANACDTYVFLGWAGLFGSVEVVGSFFGTRAQLHISVTGLLGEMFVSVTVVDRSFLHASFIHTIIHYMCLRQVTMLSTYFMQESKHDH